MVGAGSGGLVVSTARFPCEGGWVGKAGGLLGWCRGALLGFEGLAAVVLLGCSAPVMGVGCSGGVVVVGSGALRWWHTCSDPVRVCGVGVCGVAGVGCGGVLRTG